MTGHEIQSLRRTLGENTETFGARFARSGRTIEDWEQGRRNPDPLAQKLLQELADAHRRKAAKKPGRKSS